MQLEGIIRGLKRIGNGTTQPFRMTSLGNQGVDNGMPFKAEMARSGWRYAAVVGNGATFKAPITAIPTLTATWGLYNAEPDGGRCFFIDTVGFFLASGVAAVGGTLLGAVSLARQTTVPAAYAGSVISNLCGGKPNNSNAVLANNLTIVGGQPAWHSLDAGDWPAATTIGVGRVVQVMGGIMVPPGNCLFLDLLSGAGTAALYGVSITFDVLDVDRE